MSLKVLGKIIDGSGLYQSFEEAGIYGSTTIQQIKDGKHLYRSLEAHFTLYIALYKSYIQKLIENKPEAIGKKLHDGLVSSTVLLSCHGEYKSSNVQEIHKSLLDLLVSTKFAEIQQSLDARLTRQAKFLRNYMKLFESLLLFLRATPQQSWDLHLASLNDLSQYFFAYDMINYARLTPVYLAQMYALKDSDPVTWDLFKQGNFSVNKTKVAFSAIGCDHAMEQQNRAMKVFGGIKGIANNVLALEQYFLLIPEIGGIIEEFNSLFNIERSECKRDTHYQLSGKKNQRLIDNVKKLTQVFEVHKTNFDDSDAV